MSDEKTYQQNDSFNGAKKLAPQNLEIHKESFNGVQNVAPPLGTDGSSSDTKSSTNTK